MSSKRNVFVTVGTTKFDGLVEAVLTEEVQLALKRQGYTDLLVQAGNSLPAWDKDAGLLPVQHYAFKPSLLEDIAEAALVISHAGAGTCLEVQSAAKPHVVVVNETLMNNHQLELAQKLADGGHLLYCVPATLADTLDQLSSAQLTPLPPGSPAAFANYLDKLLEVGADA